jgi:hypothetical protein
MVCAGTELLAATRWHEHAFCLLELVEAIRAVLLNDLGENNRKLYEGHHVEQDVRPKATPLRSNSARAETLAQDNLRALEDALGHFNDGKRRAGVSRALLFQQPLRYEEDVQN